MTKPDGQQVEIALDSPNRQTAGDSEDQTDRSESGEDESGENDSKHVAVGSDRSDLRRSRSPRGSLAILAAGCGSDDGRERRD